MSLAAWKRRALESFRQKFYTSESTNESDFQPLDSYAIEAYGRLKPFYAVAQKFKSIASSLRADSKEFLQVSTELLAQPLPKADLYLPNMEKGEDDEPVDVEESRRDNVGPVDDAENVKPKDPNRSRDTIEGKPDATKESVAEHVVGNAETETTRTDAPTSAQEEQLPAVAIKELRSLANDLDGEMDQRVMKPVHQWIISYNSARSKKQELEKLRLEVDSRRRQCRSLMAESERLKTKLKQNPEDKYEQNLERTYSKHQRKEAKLEKLWAEFETLEADLYEDVVALVSASAYFALHIRAVAVLQKEGFGAAWEILARNDAHDIEDEPLAITPVPSIGAPAESDNITLGPAGSNAPSHTRSPNPFSQGEDKRNLTYSPTADSAHSGSRTTVTTSPKMFR